MASTSIDIFTEFKNDSTFAVFLAEEFDVQSHTTELVQAVVIADHLSKLTLGLDRVEKQLQQHVGEHYEELLQQATGIDTLENTLATIQARTQTLQAGVERVRARIVEPYTRLEKHTLMLARLQCTCELLRRLLRCLAVTKRLQSQLDNCPRDITKAASSITELEELCADGEVAGVLMAEGSEALAKSGRKEVEKQAKEMLQKGAATHNQTQVGTALQVFHNLGCLGESVEAVVEGLLHNLRDTITSTLDHTVISQAANTAKKGSNPGKAAMPALGQSSQFRAALWANLEKLMNDIYITMLQTHQLHKVLVKKRDPLTHVVFLKQVEEHCGGHDLFSRVWETITTELSQHFAQAAQGSHFIRQALEVDYPKLVLLYGDLWRRLEGVSGEMRRLGREGELAGATLLDAGEEHFNDTADSVSGHVDPESMLRESLLPLEKAFLTRSLSRLFDPVNLMFSSLHSPPSKPDLDAFIKTITSEVNVSSVDGALSEHVARNVLKAVQLLCSKCEHMMPADQDATQVIDIATEQQQIVVATHNQLLYMRGQLERALSAGLSHLTLTGQAHNTLRACLPAVDAVLKAGVEPLFGAIISAIEAILLTMHQEDFSSNDNNSSSVSSQCSLYMRELQSFLARAATDYIAPFQSSHVIKANVERVCVRLLWLFVRHASLLRPVGDAGKLRLAADFAQLEEGISALCSRPCELGDAYKALRSARPLLFLTPQHVIRASCVGHLLPHSLVLHFLFARAPSDLRSPHHTANWSIAQYVDWLDAHPGERERLEMIAGALEGYARAVRRAGSSHYAPVYPVMVQALREGLKAVGGSLEGVVDF